MLYLLKSRASRWLMVALLATLSVGCSHPAEGPTTISIAYLRSLYDGYPRKIDQPIAIEGEVVSDDRYGNFYHTLVLQDSSAGIPIIIDHNVLHTLHPVGNRVRVNCFGLTLGSYGKSVRLGGESERDVEVGALDVGQWQRCATDLGPRLEVSPKTIEIAQIGAREIATLVSIEDVTIVEGGELWSDAAERRDIHIVDSRADTLIVRLSPYEELYGSRLPEGRVDVVGVVDYFVPRYQLVISSSKSVIFKE